MPGAGTYDDNRRTGCSERHLANSGRDASARPGTAIALRHARLHRMAWPAGKRRRPGTGAEQVDDLFNTFLRGQPLVYMKQFRSIRAEKNAVWELKTPDVRIFGWFLKKDCFVGVLGNWADGLKAPDLYRGYRIAIRRMRRELGVDETLCVQGVTPGDVVS